MKNMQDFKDSQLLSAEDIYAQVLNVQRENEENQKKTKNKKHKVQQSLILYYRIQ